VAEKKSSSPDIGKGSKTVAVEARRIPLPDTVEIQLKQHIASAATPIVAFSKQGSYNSDSHRSGSE
jgi:hypothetical protein